MIEVLAQFWEASKPAHQFVGAVTLSLTTAGLLAIFRPKVKLIWGSTSVNAHSFKISDEGDPIFVWTEKLYVQNTGRKAASKVDVILNDIPSSYSLWPPREHTRRPLEGGGFLISIPYLAPKELLIVDTIDIDRKNLHLVTVNSPDTLSQSVKFLPQRQFGSIFNVIVGYLMFSGLVGTLYFLLDLAF